MARAVKPTRLPTPKANGMEWPVVAAETWLLGVESSWVIWHRCMTLAGGGKVAEREATRMVVEKVQAQVELATTLATGGFGSDPSQIASRTIDHYRTRVRANRSRLSR
jgi:hypothetical protein